MLFNTFHFLPYECIVRKTVHVHEHYTRRVIAIVIFIFDRNHERGGGKYDPFFQFVKTKLTADKSLRDLSKLQFFVSYIFL